MPEFMMLATGVALAHGGLSPDQSAGPTIVSVLLLCALGAAYGKGVQQLWDRRGVGATISRARAVAFGAGLAVLAVAISPPLHRLAEESFAGHMAQHMLMLVVAGPLLGLGGGALALTMALPHRARRGLA